MEHEVDAGERARRALDDDTKSCVYVPPSRRRAEPSKKPRVRAHKPPSSSLLDEYDLPSGSILREKACEKAWRKCKRQIHKAVEDMHAPLADSIAATVYGAYYQKNILPGLPYPEIPVVTLSGGTESLHHSILHRLSSPPPDTLPAICAHLRPTECTTLAAAMRSLVCGFVPTDGPHTKRPAASLAAYDINLLRTWYAAQDGQPTLVVLLHDFEQFSQAVLQDVFEICSLHIPQLRLVFVLLLCGSEASAALQAYPRATRALLAVEAFAALPEAVVVAEAISKMFFDSQFDPDVMLGPATLEYILEHVQRYGGGVDFLLTALQLAHMKHFSQPLSILVQPSTLTPDQLASPEAQRFALALYARLHPHPELLEHATPGRPSNGSQRTSGQIPDAQTLLAAVEKARQAFQQATGNLRRAVFHLLLVKDVLRANADDDSAAAVALYDSPRKGKGKARAGGASRESKMTAGGSFERMEVMLAALRGRAGKEVESLRSGIARLSAQRLRQLLRALSDSLDELADATDSEIQETRTRVHEALEQRFEDDNEGTNEGAIADDLAEWLGNFIDARLVKLDECALWNVWYMGSTPFPSELINPAPRATLVSALLYPHAFSAAHSSLHLDSDWVREDENEAARERSLWELPDTSILFRRCVEAGRMVNVYDWFQAFVVVLEEQRRRLRRLHAVRSTNEGTPTNSKTPLANGKAASSAYGHATSNGNRKGKWRALDDEDEDEPEGDEEIDKDEEEWRIEVQARFVHALHEMDYLGFVKSTGRKVDHVVRTTFDVPD